MKLDHEDSEGEVAKLSRVSISAISREKTSKRLKVKDNRKEMNIMHKTKRNILSMYRRHKI